jgi:hypothetical protein
MITKTALAKITTIPTITEEDTATAEEIVVKDMVVMDTKSPTVFMAMAKEKAKREEDREIERVGGGELRRC